MDGKITNNRRIGIVSLLLFISGILHIFVAMLDILGCENLLWSMRVVFETLIGFLTLTQFPELPSSFYHGMAYLYLCIGMFDISCGLWIFKISSRPRKAIIIRCFFGGTFGIFSIITAISVPSLALESVLEALFYFALYGAIAILLFIVAKVKGSNLLTKSK